MQTKIRSGSILLAALLAGAKAGPAYPSAQQEEALCDTAARSAASHYGVPADILLSIARVETGRGTDHAPWPWTINVSGEGKWFDTPTEAIEFAAQQLDQGNANFDVGCFQINLQWHPQAFASLEEAFDPSLNAAYAARFLAELYQTEGDWKAAVAAYHSRTPERGNAYIARVEGAYANLINAPEAPPAEAALAEIASKPNRFPLLQNGENAGFGSLVPRQSTRIALIGGAP